MLAQIPLFPEQASTTAVEVDHLVYFMTAICGVVSVGVACALFYFLVKYRARPNAGPRSRIEGATRLELAWTITPALVFLIFFWWGASIFCGMRSPPDDALEIYVVGKQWMWKIQHPEGQREINVLHVPLGRPVKLIMTSEDVIHDFFVPAFRMHMDVLPGRYTHEWFTATRVGTYHIFCSQYCGTGHATMIGEVVVMDPADFETWLNSDAEGSLALEGRKLFLKLQCVSCHSANAGARAPVLEGLYKQAVALDNGRTVIADESYLRESILKPRAKVVAGWQPIMPSFEGQVSEEDLIKVISYLKSLRPGQTPVRTEEAAPPAMPVTPAEEGNKAP